MTTADPQIRVHQKSANLHLLRKLYADRFYRQDWYLDEPFMHDKPERELGMPEWFVSVARIETVGDDMPSAVEYAILYLAHPGLDIWNQFLWTRDTDTKGQRIYVGGVNRGRTKGFQIHRHLEITEDWGVLTWAQ